MNFLFKTLIILFISSSIYALDLEKIQRKESKDFYFRCNVDYVALFQSHTSQTANDIVSLTNGISSIAQSTMMTVEDMQSLFTSGVQGTIAAGSSPYTTIELHFLVGANWRKITGPHSEASLLVTNLENVNNLYDWQQAANVESNYHEILDYADLGPWFHSSDRGRDYFCLSWFVGPRFIYYKDKLKMTSQRSSDISRFYTNCTNEMVGGLLGIEFEATPMKWFSWDLRMLGGTYCNFMKKRTLLYDYNDSIMAFKYNISHRRLAYTAEINPTITVRLRNYISFHAGYLGMYIVNVAQSPLQIGSDKANYEIWYKSNFGFQSATIGLGLFF
jgi:hypothetical protein